MVLMMLQQNLVIYLSKNRKRQQALGPGIAGCNHLGFMNTECGLPEIDVSCFPEACTSIIYDGVFVNLNYHVFGDPCSCNAKKVIDALDKTLQAKRPTYLYYGHISQSEWTQVLACEACNGGINSLDEMKGLKAFLDEHPGITGLILTTFENDNYSIEFPGFSENLKKYLEVMKTSFPQLEIGIEVSGKFLIDQFTAPVIPWLDIKVIDPVTDFFVISVMFLNDCTCENDLFSSGVAPMTSKTTNYTLEKLKCILPEASFPKEKTYFRFRVNPSSDPNDTNTRCDLTIQKMCTHPSDTCLFCSDTLESFNEKGKFAKDNGVGFFTSNLDINDPTNLCKCEKPFASFYALLDGFNGVTSKPCNLFIRK
ncbi:uncharacterized protein LOC100158692 isoform X2 [Acyrthosiphon pisum]|uniref:Uncharacterized protein n=1 Tax=Acyrthosiphon pisum TaxID=7029 RepID=A0A8R2JSZ1_ACYPI|nr:uncharacterized protein LOC100158692 isoform X2 [Acyrthosiphon pisum]XP_029346530.1 uncharacterized protein LOC100158692 isoform X2 [Acyrthosiphon pisum]XP_029346532.1 uncharacterized protein LOC100158692 isoform X2 [Acyrthosiphon pisum]